MIKKIIFLTTLLFGFTSVNVNADDAQSFWDRLHGELGLGIGLKTNSIEPYDISYKIHVDIISKAYAFISLESNVALYNNVAKTYYSGTSLGGGLGVTLRDVKEESPYVLDLRGQVLTNVGNTDWERTTYELALVFYLKSSIRISPLIELGYRYIDSRSLLDDYDNIYMRLGIRF